MKKFITFILVFSILSFPVQAKQVENAVTHNVKRINATMQTFNNIENFNMDNRNSVITLALKLGQVREAVNSGLSIKVDRNGAFLIYLKALGQFKKGINDAEHGLRDKNKKYFQQAVVHIQKGQQYLNKLVELIESRRSVYNE